MLGHLSHFQIEAQDKKDPTRRAVFVTFFMSWPAQSVIWFPDLNFRSKVLMNSNIAFRLIGMKLVLFVFMLSRLAI